MKITNEQFLECYNQGMNDVEISRKFEVSESSVNVLRRKLGLDPVSRKVISDELFFELYNQGLSDDEIAKQSGASEAQIRRRRYKYNLPLNRKLSDARKKLDKYFLDLYHSGLDDREIAKKLGVGHTPVGRYRNNLGLPPVDKTIDKDKLIELFNSGKSDKEIAEILGYSKSYTKRTRLQLGLRYSEKSIPSEYKLSEDEFQVILGSLLGDGSIRKPHKNGGGSLCISHCVAQEEYIRFKQKLLENISSEVKVKNVHDNRFKNPDYQQLTIYTTFTVELGKMRENWYIPKKRVYKEDVKKLSALGLAIWYMDDGYKNKPYGGCTLCTCGFPREDLAILKEVLKNNFNIESFFEKRKDNCLYIPSKEFPKFKEIVDPYIVPCLKYKVSS